MDKNTAAIISAWMAENGRKGGASRARVLSSARRSEIARLGAKARNKARRMARRRQGHAA